MDWREDERRDRPRGRMRRDDHYDARHDERDFFDRASDEVRSWFGDERAQRRRRRDERDGLAGDGYKNQHFDFEDDFTDAGGWRNVDHGYRRAYDDDDYRARRPGMEIDDGRRRRRERGETGDFDRVDTYDYDRGYTQNRWGRPQTQAEYTSDRDYAEWRTRQIEALDRDYEEWRSENQARFDEEFTSWREARQHKRDQLRQLGEEATVVGSDGEPIGTISSIRGDRMILKDDGDDRRCVFSLRHVDQVGDRQVRLTLSSDDVRRRLRDEAPFGDDHRPGQRSAAGDG